MKKNKIVALLIICLSLLVGSLFINQNKTFAEGEISGNNTPITIIDDANDFANLTPNTSGEINGKYSLKNDLVLSDAFNGLKGVFTGSFNGNGHSITFTSSNPLFETIGKDAEVYNLEILNSNVLINDIGTSEEQNIGILAGTITNAKQVSKIKIVNAKVSMANTAQANEEPVYSNLITKSNIGLLAGKVTNGANINNCFVSGNMDLIIGNTSNTISIGGLVGYVGNATISNNIVNLYLETNNNPQKTINFSSNNQASLIFGGLVGVMDFEANYIYNNVVLLTEQNINLPNNVTLTFGSFIGSLLYEPYLTNINGFITTYNGNYFGNRTSNTHSYNNFYYYTYANFSTSLFEDDGFWYDKQEYIWDFNTVWMRQSSSNKSITLQCYESFNISFNIDESLNTLSLVDTKPTGTVLTYDIKSNGTSLITPPGQEEPLDSCLVNYGETIEIAVTLNTESNYNKFFKISGLELNGKPIFNVNQPNKDYGYSVTLKQTTPATEAEEPVTFIISGINANHIGEYNVTLTRTTYYLKTSVFDVGTEETGEIIPGKFKTNSNNNLMEEDVLELKYGEKYIINTSTTNTDYSDKALWFIFKNDELDPFQQAIEFSPIEANANLSANSFQFTFNENCELFNKEANSLSTIFELDKYTETVDGNDITSNYELKIVYVKRVKQIKIVLIYNNEEEEQIKEQIAILAIAQSAETLEYKSDRFQWNAEEGVYYAKMPFDKGTPIDYVIKIDQMETGYEFIDWFFDYDIERLTNIDGDDFAGGFEISEYTEEPLTIYCVFKEAPQNLGANLLWLWLTLAGVGAVVIILVLVIISKKRKARSSYKKYYF